MKRIKERWLRVIHKVATQIKNHRFYPQSNSKSEKKKIFDSLFCTTTVNEPKWVLNSYKNTIKFGEKR